MNQKLQDEQKPVVEPVQLRDVKLEDLQKLHKTDEVLGFATPDNLDISKLNALENKSTGNITTEEKDPYKFSGESSAEEVEINF